MESNEFFEMELLENITGEGNKHNHREKRKKSQANHKMMLSFAHIQPQILLLVVPAAAELFL